MDGPAQLPPKPDVALALLQTAKSVFVHLDPRGPDVRVPAWFKKQPQLVLQVGMNMEVAIPDLDVGKTALSCTLSFNRRPEFCHIPWEAVYGLVGDDGRGMIWPDSIPPEVASARDSNTKESKPTRGHLRLAHSDRAAASGNADVEGGAIGEEPVEGAAVDVVPPGVSVPPPLAPSEADTRLSGNSNAAPRSLPGVEPAASVLPASQPETSSLSSGEQAPSEAPSGGSSRGSRPSKLPPYLRVVK
jgi:hypothetical protein